MTDADIAVQISENRDAAPDMTEALLSGAGTIVRPPVDVAGIRRRLGLTQQAFAERIGVGKGLVADWEQGRKRPSGPARTLLTIVDRLGWQALDVAR